MASWALNAMVMEGMQDLPSQPKNTEVVVLSSLSLTHL
jgi:hypothetical protein